MSSKRKWQQATKGTRENQCGQREEQLVFGLKTLFTINTEMGKGREDVWV
jgi:hypothetical protein